MEFKLIRGAKIAARCASCRHSARVHFADAQGQECLTYGCACEKFIVPMRPKPAKAEHRGLKLVSA